MIDDLKYLFEKINSSCLYVVLRNWDDIFNESIYGTGHEDIDILCGDKNEFINATDAIPVHNDKCRDNYLVPCGTRMVRFDIRWVGDGYYPKDWEMRMLVNRELNDNGIFIMSKEDYCFSLAYHALLQKPTLSVEYLKKIQETYASIGISKIIHNQSELLIELKSFMDKNSYSFVIASDPAVFINWQNVKQLKKNLSLYYLYRRVAYRIKNRITRK